MYSTQNLTKISTTWDRVTAGDVLDGELVIATETHDEGSIRAQYSDFTWSPWRHEDDPVSVHRDTREHTDCVCC